MNEPLKLRNAKQAKRFLAAVAVVYAVVAASASAATLKGNVRYSGAPVERKKYTVTIDQYVCGKEKLAGDLVLSPKNGILNAVVSLEGVATGAKGPMTATRVIMDQKECVFTPRVVVVPAGGTVEFLNSDRLLHNVKGGGKQNSPFNRAQPHARSISIAFRSPEILRVDCDLHSWMRGWVVVAEHPYYAVTNEEGEFAFDNVPPGKYQLVVWHETLGVVRQEATLTSEANRPLVVRMQMNNKGAPTR
jgi:plastocyanin